MPLAAGHVPVGHTSIEFAVQPVSLKRSIKVETTVIKPGSVRSNPIAIVFSGGYPLGLSFNKIDCYTDCYMIMDNQQTKPL